MRKQLCSWCAGIAIIADMILTGGNREDVLSGADVATIAARPTVFYCDPENGSVDGDGSIGKPWGPLRDVISTKQIRNVQPGDTILLRAGRHGDVTITNFTVPALNKFNVTIAAYPNEEPVINKLTVRNHRNWTFKNLTICPPAPDSDKPLAAAYAGSLVELNGCDDVLFMGNTVTAKIGDTSWTAATWTAQTAKFGIVASGNRLALVNNLINEVKFAVSVGGDSITVYGNQIDLFSNDALDCTASNAVIRGNLITNLFTLNKTDTSHHDSVQLWSVGADGSARDPDAVVRNVLIEQNTIIHSTGKYAFLPKLPSGLANEVLQGITITDGRFQNVDVLNNVVVCTAANGIGMAGVNGCRIINNTVVSQFTDLTATVAYASITVRASKNGVDPVDNIVRNNIANLFSIIPGAGTGNVCDHNISLLVVRKKNTWGADPTNVITADPKQLFMNYSQTGGGLDFHLPIGSSAIGKAVNVLPVDRDGVNRRAVIGVDDIGAYYVTGR